LDDATAVLDMRMAHPEMIDKHLFGVEQLLYAFFVLLFLHQNPANV
jgi:hypothetical protein